MLNINELKRVQNKDQNKNEELINDFYLTKRFDLNDTELMIFKAAMKKIDHGTLEVLENVISVLTVDKLNTECPTVVNITLKETVDVKQHLYDCPECIVD